MSNNVIEETRTKIKVFIEKAGARITIYQDDLKEFTDPNMTMESVVLQLVKEEKTHSIVCYDIEKWGAWVDSSDSELVTLEI